MFSLFIWDALGLGDEWLYSLINENGTFYYRTIQNKDHSEIWDPILNEISLNMQR